MENVRVLIVEDNFSYSIKLEMMLENLGCQKIDKAETSQEAFAHIALHRPDLILMDIQLKGKLTGIDVATKIKDKNIPVIFLTAFMDDENFEKAQKTMPYAYLNKPFDETILKRTIMLALVYTTTVKESPENGEEKAMFIRQSGKMKKVGYGSILWIKADGNYCYIQTEEKKFAIKISLVRMMKKLPLDIFIRIHRNFIVQIDKVQQINLIKNELELQNQWFSIGATFRKGVLKQFKS